MLGSQGRLRSDQLAMGCGSRHAETLFPDVAWSYSSDREVGQHAQHDEFYFSPPHAQVRRRCAMRRAGKGQARAHRSKLAKRFLRSGARVRVARVKFFSLAMYDPTPKVD